MGKIGIRSAVLVLALAVPAAVWSAATAVQRGKSDRTVVHKGPRGRTVVHKGPRGRVVVHRNFPIRRRLPKVYVRAPRVKIRVAPRVYLPRLVFPAVVVKVRPAPAVVVWHEVERFEIEEGWIDASLAIAHAGTHLYFEVADGPARVSFVEIVYADGETQVVDFDDEVYAPGYYGLLELGSARGVDHVRLVASAETDTVGIGFHLAL